MKASYIQIRVKRLFGDGAVPFIRGNDLPFGFGNSDIDDQFWVAIRRGRKYIEFGLSVEFFESDESEWLPGFQKRIDVMFSRIKDPCTTEH